MTVRALVLPAAGAAELRDIDGADLKGLQRLVGGFLEAVSLSRGAHAWINEDGKTSGLPVNAAATTLWWTAVSVNADVLVGDVVVLGDGPDGEEADCPQWVLDLVRPA